MSFDVKLREIQFKTISFYLCCLFQKKKKRQKERKNERKKKKGRRLDNEEVTQKFKM